jgi:voltage-gated sodium channel
MSTREAEGAANPVQAFARRVVNSRRFEPFMITLILINAALIGLETSPEFVAKYDGWLHAGNDIILGVFIIEAVLKITAVAPRWGLYFRSGWNLFDLAVIVFSLIPATDDFALVARLVRVLRVLRLISAVPQLRLVIATLVRSIPSMGHVILLMSIILYIYGVTGFHLFSEVDEEHWGTLGASLLTLFQMVTLEGWVEVMEATLDAQPFAWIYFVTFILIGTFVVLNLFIAVVINNLDQSKAEQLQELNEPATHQEIIEELDRTRKALQDLQRKISRLEPHT